MKTQRKTFRGIVTSSILTFVLAANMVPVSAIAFAAEQHTDAAQEASQQADAANDAAQDANSEAGSTPVPAITNETIALESTNSQNGENGSSGAYADERAQESYEQTQTQIQTPQAPAYTNVAEGITSVDVSLAPATQTLQVVGSVEYGGIRYTINPDDLTTVSATGLASTLPTGDLEIQSQVAISGTLYPVTAIEKSLGGGSQI